MNKDIRISTSYFNHPKVMKLKDKYGADGIIAHFRLLCFVAEYRPKGNLIGLSNLDIKIASGWAGDADEFVSFLTEVKLLDKLKKCYRVHNWPKRNPYAFYSDERVERARAAAKSRWDKEKGRDAK